MSFASAPLELRPPAPARRRPPQPRKAKRDTVSEPATDVSAPVLVRQGLALESIGEVGRARMIWARLVQTGDTAAIRRVKAYRKLASEQFARCEYGRAAELLERHLVLQPDDRAASDKLLRARISLGEQGHAAEIYAAHVGRFGESLSTLILRALLVEAADDRSRALTTLTTAEARATDDEQRRTVARAFEKLGEPRRALDVLSCLDPKGFGVDKTMRARLRLLQMLDDRSNDAIEAARSLTAADPSVAANHALLGRTLKRADDLSGAVAAFEEALRRDLGDVGHWEALLRGCAALDQHERVSTLLAQGRAVFGDGPESAISLARIELAGGCPDRAAIVVRKAIRNPILERQARPILAEALMQTGAYHEAWEHLSEMMRDGADESVQLSAIRCGVAFRMASGGTVVPNFPDALFVRALRDPPARPLIEPTDTVLLVTSSLGAGGAERQVALTAAGVARSRGGVRRTVLAGMDLAPSRGRSIMRKVAETDNLEIEDLGGFDEARVFRAIACEDPRLRDVLSLIASFPRRLSRDILKLYDCFRRHRPSVVHLWQDGVISTGAVAAVLAGVPVIACSMRNVVASEGDRRRYRPYLKTMYLALSARPEVRFSANSAAGAEAYRQWLDLPPGAIRTLRNGVEVEAIRGRAPPGARERIRDQLGVSRDMLLVGGVFRLAPAKRPHLWLDVVAKVAALDPRVRGVIVGDGSLRGELTAAIEARGLGDRIWLAGRQSPVEPWIAAMDALLLASEVEGLPNVLLEAESLGVPVVTTEAGGSSEALIDGVTGILVRDDAPATLADALRKIIQSAPLRHRARVGSPVFIEHKFGLSRMLRETLELFGSTNPEHLRVPS